VPFRLAYSHELIPMITKMVGSPKDLIVVNGLILSGDLATNEALDIVHNQVGAKAPAVRYQAGYALLRTFQAAHDSQPAIERARLGDALKDIRDRIGQEPNANIVDMFVRAGLAGMKIDGLVNDAISAVSRGTIQGAKGAKNPGGVKEAEALLRAADGVQLAIGEAVGRNTHVGGQAATDAAEMAGVLIVRVSHMVEKKELALDASDPLRIACAQVVSASQKLIRFSGQALQPGGTFELVDATGAPIDLGMDLKAGTNEGDARFSTDVDAVRAMLTKGPFNVAAEKLK
jgi:hypothetical protein